MKICAKHGQLNEENCYKEKSSRNPNIIRIRCHICKLEKDAKWRDNNKEKRVAYSMAWKEKNRDHYNAWLRADRAKHPEKYREYEKQRRAKRGADDITVEILWKFKITKEQYEDMFKQQNNLCAVCGKEETRRSRTEGNICRLALDHCHPCEETHGMGIHAIRGLLCHSCNIMLGKAKDDENILNKAIQYLKSHKHA